MWLAIATTALAVWSCHWDLQVRWQAVGLHVVGFAATLCLLNSLHLRSDPLTWSAPLFLAAYSLASSYLISRREGLGAALRQLRLLPAAATAPASEPLGLILSNSVLAGGIVMLAFGAQFRCNVGAFRLAAAQSIFAQALALGLLATSSARTRAADRRGGEGPATGWKDGAAPTGAREEASSNAASISERLRFAALALAVLGVIAFGWSFLMPDKPWLFERLTITAVAVSAMSMCYGFGLVKLVRRPGIWSETARRMMPTLLFLSTLVVGIALAVEVTAHVTRGGSPEFLATVGIAATLGVACVASLVAALAPGRDPWGLSAHYRPAYVYAAEIILLMLVVHFRVAMPWLFSGLLQQIWPLLVMAIAFCGIGLSEWAERRQIDVLSKPLGKTGALLPLLPALGFWMLPSHIHYSFLMVVVGATYGVLAYLRRSTGFALLALIAVNGGLWYLLDQNAIEFLKHPQVWLIPPAICALAAAHWNRDRLGHEQIEAVRYGASMVIYVASTSEVFVQGIAQAPWLPLVLAGLSLIGIAAGIAWQVRAFLWLGTCFLLVALFSMIWYAAVDLGWTWLWYVSGIVAGVMILGIFAWLEKKRIRAAE